MDEEMPVAIITGANRGLGLETCRQLAIRGYRVILTSRDAAKGRAATDGLRQQGLQVEYHLLDVADADSIAQLARDIERDYGRLDGLVNNTGVFLDSIGSNDPAQDTVFAAELDVIRESMETNVYGPLRLCQLLIPLMRGRGRVVNVSSGMGQLSDMNGCCPGYRLSKTAINAVTRIFADELKGTHIKVNSVCPGWVRTDMGGPGATLSVGQGVETIVWLATLPEDGPSGGFFRNKQPIPW